MKKFLAVVAATTFITPVLAASNNNATAIGAAQSSSNSQSQATAISGQGGQGGKGGKGGQGGIGVGIGTGGNVNIAAAPANTHTTVDNTGSLTTVPNVFAPGLAAAGLETCLGSVSMGASWLGTGLSGGGTIPDPGCAARLDARTLWSFGLKKAAIARLCLNTDIDRAMPDVCSIYLPRQAPVYAPVPVAPASYYAEEGQPYRGGPIMLVEGKTGKERLCNDYDEPGQRCRVWAGIVSSKPKMVMRTTWSREKEPAASPSVVKAKKESESEPHPAVKLTESQKTPLFLQLAHPEIAGKVEKPEKEVKNAQNDESLTKCLGFCAANGQRR